MNSDQKKKDIENAEELYWYQRYVSFVNMLGDSVFTTREKGALFCWEFRNNIPKPILIKIVKQIRMHEESQNDWLTKVERWIAEDYF